MSTTQGFPSYGGIGVHASPSWSRKCLVCAQFHNNSGSRGGTPSIEDASAVERGASRRDHAAPSLSSAAGPVSSGAGAPGAARPRHAHPQSGPPAGSSFFGPMSLPAGVQARQKADMKVPARRALSSGTCCCLVFVVAAASQEHWCPRKDEAGWIREERVAGPLLFPMTLRSRAISFTGAHGITKV